MNRISFEKLVNGEPYEISLSEEEKRQNEYYIKGYIDAMKAQGWIPCSRGLPQRPMGASRWLCFLATLENGCIELVAFDTERREWGHTESQVVAWQPLPEPYHEDD